MVLDVKARATSDRALTSTSSERKCFDPGSRHQYIGVMGTISKCSNCGRCGGAEADGATINTMGCTGACLHWAVQFMRNCLPWDQGNPWEQWSANPKDAVCFRLIGAGISELGLGYVHWIQTDACAVLKEMHDRYACFVTRVHPLDVAARCPDEVKNII